MNTGTSPEQDASEVLVALDIDAQYGGFSELADLEAKIGCPLPNQSMAECGPIRRYQMRAPQGVLSDCVQLGRGLILRPLDAIPRAGQSYTDLKTGRARFLANGEIPRVPRQLLSYLVEVVLPSESAMPKSDAELSFPDQRKDDVLSDITPPSGQGSVGGCDVLANVASHADLQNAYSDDYTQDGNCASSALSDSSKNGCAHTPSEETSTFNASIAETTPHDQFMGVAGAAQQPKDSPANSPGPVCGNSASLADSGITEPRWPTLDADALHGPIGDFVRLIEPVSEADPAGLLVQALVGIGSVLGRRFYFEVEADKHYSNLFAVMVGETSKGRKGTSWGQVIRLLKAVDPTWEADCVKGGLATGEGLIHHVRDPLLSLIPPDPGVADKRLLTQESEFARVLQVAERENNTLSAIIRLAWDTGDLRVLTKSQSATATGAHISIVGHITVEELKKRMRDTSVANGLANRFLWVCVRRSKYLSRGSKASSVDLTQVVTALQSAKKFAAGVSLVDFDSEAGQLWDDIYPVLSTGGSGLTAAVTSRAEAQVIRLASLFAVVDQSVIINITHLRAALAVWKYCEESAAYIWGRTLGHEIADKILIGLRDCGQKGARRSEIGNFFQRHMPIKVIDEALSYLADRGLARSKKVRGTGGRAAEVWYAI